jgi:hypothetical protein
LQPSVIEFRALQFRPKEERALQLSVFEHRF